MHGLGHNAVLSTVRAALYFAACLQPLRATCTAPAPAYYWHRRSCRRATDFLKGDVVSRDASDVRVGDTHVPVPNVSGSVKPSHCRKIPTTVHSLVIGRVDADNGFVSAF